jgi:CBS-domain-containing membrane protein
MRKPKPEFFSKITRRATDLFKRRATVNVDKLMTKDVRWCYADASTADAARIMWERDCGFVPVIDASERLVGVITDRDICMASYLKNRNLNEISVREVMATDLYTCRPEDSIQTAENVMRQAQVRRLPVTNASNRLVGVLSLNDVAREAERERKAAAPDVPLDGVALTLSAVSQQHTSVRTAALTP